MNLTGLTDAQVSEKIKQGKVNRFSKSNRSTIPGIVLRNTLTIFNLVNLILALMIISVGAYKNLFFLLVAIANTLISIINSIRAKKTIDKMRLISEQKPTVIRSGKTLQIPQEQIVEGDFMVYSLGDQILVDSRVAEGQIEVNEAFITGEQANIAKQSGDELASGSFVVSGTCYAVATKVGADSGLAKLESAARFIKPKSSKLFTIINNIVKYISYALIPVGALLLWSRFRVSDTTAEVAVTSTVAGLISMIPEGLVLLTSSVLALATIRLSRKQVLVQDLYSVETLARVDTIALDKTGTLTTGRMSVHEFILPDGATFTRPSKTQTPAEKSLLNALKLILSNDTASNATSTALKQTLLKTAKFEPTEQIREIIPFSSDRKYSGVVTDKATYLMGAPEFLGTKSPNYDNRYRMIAVAKTMHSSTKLLGYVTLEDELRHDAKNIIDYFYANDIDVKIISGDSKETVQSVAASSGVKDSDQALDLSTVKNPNYSKLVREYTIFACVKPAEKKHLIEALKKHGRTVAMTGDGVNDILAMKEADCSIAIGEGTDAARKAAKLVLLGSDFSAVPSIIDEGRRSINNLERSATLFLNKNAYAAILAVLFIILPLEYPYAPIEMSLLNFLCIGLPGLVLALEKNTSRIKDQFVKNIQRYSIPTAILIAASMLVLSIVAESTNLDRPHLITLSAIITFAINLTLLYRISRPLTKFRATLFIVIIALFALAIVLPISQHFFDFAPLWT